MPFPLRCISLVPVFVAAFFHCVPATHEVPSPPLDDAFDLIEVVELQEATDDSIAEVGLFIDLEPDGFAIADNLLPRVRTYGEDGSFLAAFGRFGSGPWELQRVSGIAAMSSGKIVVADGSNQWITVLNRNLTPDTLMPVSYLVGRMFAQGGDIVFAGWGPTNSAGSPRIAREDLYASRIVHKLADGEVIWSRWTAGALAKPYYGSLGRIPATVAGDSTFIMTSLAYPATILDADGDSVGFIGTASPRFRPIPEIPVGYFATDQSGPRMTELLRSFDEVSRLDVIHNDYLVLTIGRLDDQRPLPPFRRLHTRVEVYDRYSGEKLYEDLALPEGSKVVGGGRYLYLLLNPDIPPWRIAKYRLVTDQ